jgi:hypothetical protein
MTNCLREHEVLDAIVLQRWPDDLRTHVDGCLVCAELAMVAAALSEEGYAARSEAHPPTSGQVWWRATMRTRAEAARAAARPITVLQALAAACTVGLFAGLLTRSWASIGQPFTWIAAVVSAVTMQPAIAVGLLLSAALILAPFVLYLVLSDE